MALLSQRTWPSSSFTVGIVPWGFIARKSGWREPMFPARSTDFEPGFLRGAVAVVSAASEGLRH